MRLFTNLLDDFVNNEKKDSYDKVKPGWERSLKIINAMQRQGINIVANTKNPYDEVKISKAAMGVFLRMVLG